MIERLNMLGATPESSSEAAKPADDPHGAASPSAPRLIATARAPLDSAVSKISNPAILTQASSAHRCTARSRSELLRRCHGLYDIFTAPTSVLKCTPPAAGIPARGTPEYAMERCVKMAATSKTRNAK